MMKDEKDFYIEALQARLKLAEESALYQHDRIVATDKRLAEAERLLREARQEVEWWTPRETTAAVEERPRLNRWFLKRDRIDAFLGATDSANEVKK